MAGEHKKACGSFCLHEDIIFDILSYLPAKSVARFRSVSRSWRAMISSASFVDLHLRRANRRDQLKVFFRSSRMATNAEHPRERYFYSWQLHGGPAKKLMRDDFAGAGFPSPVTKPLHGLVLLRYLSDGGYYVFNPSTNAVLALPDTKFPLKNSTDFVPSLSGYNNVSYGLGYCSATGEYKVVRLFSDPDGGEAAAATNGEVFVLDAPACWRPTAQQPPPEFMFDESNPGVFLNGLLHFLCLYGYDVITFDVGDETFGSAPPLPVDEAEVGVVTLTELNGCLAAFYPMVHGDNNPYHISLLRDHDHEAAHWEQLCRIDMAAWPEADQQWLRWAANVEPLTTHVDGGGEEKIIFRTWTCEVFAFDLFDGAAAPPEILFTPPENSIVATSEEYCRPRLGLFEESLVPVGRSVEEIVFSSPATRAWSDVLKWLPARTVSELSLVCREWRAMVTTNRFIRSHTVHANQIGRHPQIKFAMNFVRGKFADLDDLIISGDQPKVSDSTLFICSQPCHGLNLGSYHMGNYVLNPCMGYRAILPDRDVWGYLLLDGRVALGYDAATGRHVVVHLAYKKRNLENRAYELRCHVMLVGDDNEWGRARSPPPRPVAEDVPPAYANGKIYWVVDSQLGAPPSSAAACELVALDMEAREFEVIQGPPCRHGDGKMTILELHGALCVACSDKARDTINIWMVKGDGAWSMEYRVELGEFSPEYSSETTTPMAVDPMDGRVLLNTGTSLGYYDPKTAPLETIYSVSTPDYGDDFPCRDRFCPVICQESLVRVDRGRF